jgi:heme oxygenase
MTDHLDGAADDTFSVLIRTRTWEEHEAAERAPFVQDLLGGRLPLRDYARLVTQHRAIYAMLEAAVAANGDDRIRPFLAPELARSQALEADQTFLADLVGEPPPALLEATRAYCDRLREVCFDWSGGLLAHHYVRYLGDLSGGQVIGRILRRVYGFADDRGTEFYRFDGIASPKGFKERYRDLLDALPVDPGERDRIIAEASVAFALNAELFYELAPLPILASQAHAATRAATPRGE